MTCAPTYTIKGHLLKDCPIEDLRAEADAARSLQKAGWTGPFMKLAAIEFEIARRNDVSRAYIRASLEILP